MKRTFVVASLLLLATLMLGIPAGANVLPPSGGSGAPDSFNYTVGAVLASNFGTYTINGVDNNGNPTVATGTWVTQVRLDTVSGNLDFIYGLTNSSASNDIIETLTLTNFSGFITDVGVMAGCWTGGGFTCNPTAAPTEVSRAGLNGSSIQFLKFLTGGQAGITPGSETGILVIETNAHYFTRGQFAIQDSGNVTELGFAPTSVPEPTSLVLLGSGLVGLGSFVRRKLSL